jgi:hypothetical protein
MSMVNQSVMMIEEEEEESKKSDFVKQEASL